MLGIVTLEEGLPAAGELLPDHLLGAAPAAGQPFVQALDSRWWWRFKAVRFLLTSSAVVANRLASVDYCDPEGTAWASSNAPAVQTAGVANQEYRFAPRRTTASGIAGAPQWCDLVALWVPPGWQLRINVANIDVGDTLTGIRFYVEKFEPAG